VTVRRPFASSSHRRLLAAGVALLCVGAAAGAQQCDPDPSARSLAADRFEDNGDGTITDRQRGLMWMRCAVGQRWSAGRCDGEARVLDWAAAQAMAATVNREGHQFFSDWRLPAVPELASITERACRQPRTSLQLFPGTPAAAFWTSTPRPGDPSTDRAYALSFGDGGVELRNKTETAHLRLVRTGP
jgi:hypothetical protein